MIYSIRHRPPSSRMMMRRAIDAKAVSIVGSTAAIWQEAGRQCQEPMSWPAGGRPQKGRWVAGRPLGLPLVHSLKIGITSFSICTAKTVCPSVLCLPESVAWSSLSLRVPASPSPCTHTLQAVMKPAMGH